MTSPVSKTLSIYLNDNDENSITKPDLNISRTPSPEDSKTNAAATETLLATAATSPSSIGLERKQANFWPSLTFKNICKIAGLTLLGLGAGVALSQYREEKACMDKLNGIFGESKCLEDIRSWSFCRANSGSAHRDPNFYQPGDMRFIHLSLITCDEPENVLMQLLDLTENFHEKNLVLGKLVKKKVDEGNFPDALKYVKAMNLAPYGAHKEGLGLRLKAIKDLFAKCKDLDILKQLQGLISDRLLAICMTKAFDKRITEVQAQPLEARTLREKYSPLLLKITPTELLGKNLSQAIAPLCLD